MPGKTPSTHYCAISYEYTDSYDLIYRLIQLRDVYLCIINDKRMMLLVFLSLLFWSALEIQSQTVSSPYLSFDGNNLPNNSYVDISQIGIAGDGSDSVRCISVLRSCCNDSTRTFLADWYFPNGTRLQFGDGIHESRGTHRVDLRRHNMANSPTGIYCCKIPFNVSNPSARKMLCVGVYTDQGGKYITTRYSSNPRRACAARVTVVVLCVCVCVCPRPSSATRATATK